MAVTICHDRGSNQEPLEQGAGTYTTRPFQLAHPFGVIQHKLYAMQILLPMGGTKTQLSVPSPLYCKKENISGLASILAPKFTKHFVSQTSVPINTTSTYEPYCIQTHVHLSEIKQSHKCHKFRCRGIKRCLVSPP